jgi:hypothetical protein
LSSSSSSSRPLVAVSDAAMQRVYARFTTAWLSLYSDWKTRRAAAMRSQLSGESPGFEPAWARTVHNAMQTYTGTCERALNHDRLAGAPGTLASLAFACSKTMHLLGQVLFSAVQDLCVTCHHAQQMQARSDAWASTRQAHLFARPSMSKSFEPWTASGRQRPNQIQPRSALGWQLHRCQIHCSWLGAALFCPCPQITDPDGSGDGSGLPVPGRHRHSTAGRLLGKVQEGVLDLQT